VLLFVPMLATVSVVAVPLIESLYLYPYMKADMV